MHRSIARSLGRARGRGRGGNGGHAFQGHPILCVLFCLAITGFIGSVGFSLASPALAYHYVEDSEAKSITVVVTVFYFLGIILMWAMSNLSSCKKNKAALAFYILTVAAFTSTVVSDIIAIKRWEKIELDYSYQYPKEVSIIHFAITLIFSIGLAIGFAFFLNCRKKSKNQAGQEDDKQAKPAPEAVSQTPGQVPPKQPSGETPGKLGVEEQPMIEAQGDAPNPSVPGAQKLLKAIENEATTKD